jgi:FkbM family methyltransferase
MSVPELLERTAQRLSKLGVAWRRILGMAAKIRSGPGQGLRFDAGQYTSRFASGEYERPVQDALAALVRQGDVCYDVGANLGFFSVLNGRLVGPAGIVYAFEPVPGNASVIERNARLNRQENIKVMRTALCRADGKGELLLARHVGGAVLKSAGSPPDPAGSIAVETASLDTLVGHHRIRPPNVVKIDVEGAEMEVLQGMEGVLRAWGPAVIVELDDETAESCERKAALCRSFLHDLGYRTKLLANSYPDGRWFVRHVLAQQEGTYRRNERDMAHTQHPK